MKINVTEYGGERFAEIEAEDIVLACVEDALDLIAECSYNHDVTNIIMKAENITPDFFELRTGIAGDILQKFTQYGGRFIIVGDFSDVQSRALRDFIRESNRQRRIMFVSSAEEAGRQSM